MTHVRHFGTFDIVMTDSYGLVGVKVINCVGDVYEKRFNAAAVTAISQAFKNVDQFIGTILEGKIDIVHKGASVMVRGTVASDSRSYMFTFSLPITSHGHATDEAGMVDWPEMHSKAIAAAEAAVDSIYF